VRAHGLSRDDSFQQTFIQANAAELLRGQRNELLTERLARLEFTFPGRFTGL
jgi:hypothetical protein